MKKKLAYLVAGCMLAMSLSVFSAAEEAPETEPAFEEEMEAVVDDFEEFEEDVDSTEAPMTLLEEDTVVELLGYQVTLPGGWYMAQQDDESILLSPEEESMNYIMITGGSFDDLELEEGQTLIDKIVEEFSADMGEELGMEAMDIIRDFTINGMEGVRFFANMSEEDYYSIDIDMTVFVYEGTGLMVMKEVMEMPSLESLDDIDSEEAVGEGEDAPAAEDAVEEPEAVEVPEEETVEAAPAVNWDRVVEKILLSCRPVVAE